MPNLNCNIKLLNCTIKFQSDELCCLFELIKEEIKRGNKASWLNSLYNQIEDYYKWSEKQPS